MRSVKSYSEHFFKGRQGLLFKQNKNYIVIKTDYNKLSWFEKFSHKLSNTTLLEFRTNKSENNDGIFYFGVDGIYTPILLYKTSYYSCSKMAKQILAYQYGLNVNIEEIIFEFSENLPTWQKSIK